MAIPRIHRANPFLDEALEMLDEHLYQHQGDIKKAHSSLTATEKNFISGEMEHCILDARYYLENYHVIQTEDQGLRCLTPFWESQEIFYYEIITIQRAGKPVKLLVLKARQQGASELAAGLVFHKTVFTETCNALIVAQDPSQSDFIFSKSRTAYDYLPWWMKPEQRYDAKGRYMVFDKKDDTERQLYPGLRSQFIVEAANKMCLCPGTMVMSDRGLVPIETVVPGDILRGPTCKPIQVVGSFKRQSPKKTGTRVLAWLNGAFPIAGTDDHGIVTESGLQRLDHIKPGDHLFIPFRRIRNGGQIPLAQMSEHAFVRLKHIVSPVPNREWGFLCGLYLAEGSIGGVATSLGLSEDEMHLAERFSKACGVPLGESTRVGGSLVCRIFSSWLSSWLSQQFGTADAKHIPDWVFSCGKDFCTGLIEGALLGDGHFCKKRNDVIFVTTRPTLAVQIRELALSLRLGLGAINKSKTSWMYKGVKKFGIAYRVEFGGDAGIRVRKSLGIGTVAVKDHLRNGQKWGWTKGKDSVWVKVKSVTSCDIDVVYDVQVDSEDHLYLLPSTITHNSSVARGKTIRAAHFSELSSWGDGGILAKSIFPTMNASDELAIMESTALGRQGFFFKFWKEVERGRHEDWTPCFIPVYRTLKKYSLPFKPGYVLNPPLSKEEEAIKKKVFKKDGIMLPDEHFNWKRAMIRKFIDLTGSEWDFYGEYPSNAEEAFQGTGQSAFPRRLLHDIRDRDCTHPRWYGEIVYIGEGQGAQNKYKLHLKEAHNEDDVPEQEVEGTRLHVWEMPESDSVYYIGVDVSEGMSDDADYSCAQVIRIGAGQEPDVQVAEWRGYENPTPLGNIVTALGYMYNTAQVAVEVNGVGISTNNQLAKINEYDEVYRWKHIDRLKNSITNTIGWYTNTKTRDVIITKTREGIMEKTLVLRSAPLVEEMLDFAKEEGTSRYEGQESKDDRVFALMISYYCAHESDYGKQAAAQTPRKHAEIESWLVFDPMGRRITPDAPTKAGEKPKLGWEYDEALSFIQRKAGYSMRPLIEKNKVTWKVIDTEGKIIDEISDFDLARRMCLENKWSMRKMVNRQDFQDSDFSLIHDKEGLHQRLYDQGVPAEQITGEMLLHAQMAEGPPGEEELSEEWKNW
jgi:hypothetical protein